MATYQAVNAQKLLNVPSDKIDASSGYSKLRVLHDSISAPVLTNGDIIQFGIFIPKGARVIEVYLKYSDLGTTGTGSLGWAASSDAVEAAQAAGLMASLDFNTAAKCVLSSQNLANPLAVAKQFSASVQVQLTMTASTTVVGTIDCMVIIAVE